MDLDDAREERLLVYYRRQCESLVREEDSAGQLGEALGLVQDSRLLKLSVEFRLDDEGCYVPGRWVLASGLGVAFENYVFRLSVMEKVRFGRSSIDGFTAEHHEAFKGVVDAAEALARLGWPVNWQQNVQKILEITEYGLRDGKLVHRFSTLPEFVTLGEEMLLLGTVTFYRQGRSADGAVTSFKSQVLSATNRELYESTPLHLRCNGDDVPKRFRYTSDWKPGRSGKSYRVAI
ncbi:hypothetical protein E2F50_19375 [Rhizobium deserti]|uniref:Uncharacterized protein n=1 Tax=Rhizobium deserti TaxID=2547961 RepID=A0A4V3ANQ7_9HYPH|nr:hypothetical protein [Rhizobium deserti]TDK31825.1 hypothetical protein E2F50_19375 [Rhizobium deserti]